MAAQDSKDPEKLSESATETTPLLRRLSKRMTTTFGDDEDTYPAMPEVEQENIAWDSAQYNMGAVNSWRILLVMSGSAFDNVSILTCMLYALLISFGVALFAFHSDLAVFIKMETVHALGTFLNVFVGMLLGFFVSSSMNRWHGCVQGFMELLEAVRCMQMQMVALGVSNERIDTLNRYGLSSAWLLHLSLNNECRKYPREKVHESEDEHKKKLWTCMKQLRPHLVNSREKKLLYEYEQCYSLLWTWVASLIGRMAQDGEIPPMASPTYGRIINIVEWAYSSIRTVRMMHRIKVPFIYVHTLAILVHINTMLNAISFGLILGMTVKVAAGKDDGKIANQKLPHLVASLFMQFCISMVAPFLYLCLLEVSVCISQPFTFMDSKIPSHSLVLSLEEDLANAKEMSENTKWQKPQFKK
jgi:hypothetical protein